MRRNRRWVLKRLAGLSVAGISCTTTPTNGDPTDTDLSDTGGFDTDDTDAPPSPSAFTQGVWVPGGAEDLTTFPYGLQAGDADTSSVILSIRTAAPQVTFEVIEVQPTQWRRVFREVHSPADLAAQVEVTGLLPDTQYAWLGWSDDTHRSMVGRFRTPPSTGSTPIIRFGAVSCLGGNYPWPCLSRASEEDLDLFLLLGDTIYADWGDPDPFQVKWDQALARQGMVELAASTSFISTWDDHEVHNNWSPENTDPSVSFASLTAFREAIPQRIGPNGEMWKSFVWGDTAEFFVLDCRGERSGSEYVSPEQLAWLTQALTDSTARFKFILNSVPITDLSFIPIAGLVGAGDRWQGYPSQRSELVAHCAAIPGVVFISGDFHVGAAALIEPEENPGGHIVEILAGPGGSPISNTYRFIPEGQRIPKIITEHNYTLFECDPHAGTVGVIWVRNDGSVIKSIELTPS